MGQVVVTQEMRSPYEEDKAAAIIVGIGEVTRQHATIPSCFALVYSSPAHLTETVDLC